MVLKTIKTLISFLFFLLSLMGNKAFASESSPTLIQIFCAELITKSELGQAVGANEEAWEALTKSLENRSNSLVDLTSLSDEYASQMSDCSQRFSREFERAEFILGGKETVEKNLKTAEQNKPVKQNIPIEGSFLKAAADGLEPFVVVFMGSANSGLTSFSGSRALLDRKQRYERLWQQFLKSLREKLTSMAMGG